MANFGQRPFMFDIDGYMKVRVCTHWAHDAGSWPLALSVCLCCDVVSGRT